MKLTPNVDHVVQRKAGAGRTPKPNPFTEALDVIREGTHRIDLDGESIHTVLGHLRRAAATIDRSVSLNYLPAGSDAKTATGFAFTLVPKITRKRKPTNADTTEPDTKSAPTKPRKR